MGPFERLVEERYPMIRLENTPWGRGKVRRARTRMGEESSPAIPTTRLAGELTLADSGWCLLDVPNELVMGLFSSLDEPGVSLPTSDRFNAGKLNAHISVMDGKEVERIGKANVQQHVGRKFRYQIGPLKVVTPVDSTTWKKVWYVTVFSPELEEFRSGFGLTPKPHDNEFDFHLTIGVLKAKE